MSNRELKSTLFFTTRLKSKKKVENDPPYCTATQIGGQPPDGTVVEEGVGDGGEELGVVHDVKGLR